MSQLWLQSCFNVLLLLQAEQLEIFNTSFPCTETTETREKGRQGVSSFFFRLGEQYTGIAFRAFLNPPMSLTLEARRETTQELCKSLYTGIGVPCLY